MKKIIYYIATIFIFSNILKAQTTIEFNNFGNSKSPGIDMSKGMPLTLLFDESYKSHKVQLFSDSECKNQISKKLQVGTDISDKIENKYSLIFKKDGSVAGQEFNIKTTFYLKVDEVIKSGPFKIDIDSNIPIPDTDLKKQYKASSTPGYLLYDAIELKQLSTKADDCDARKRAQKILDFYQIKDANAVNLFLNTDNIKKLLSPCDGIPKVTAQSGRDKSNPILPNSLASLDVTNLADGFAKFIVDRTKKELQAAFFDQFIEELKNDKYEDLWTLFPNTLRVIKQLPEKVYSYEPYLQSLRDAFGKDLDGIIPNIETVVKNGHFASFFESHKELKSVSLIGLYYANSLKKGTHIGKVLEDFNPTNSDYSFGNAEADSIRINAMQFIREVSASLRTINSSANEKEYYVPYDSIERLLINDPITLNIYFGLLYQKVNKLNISPTNSLTYGGLMAQIKSNGDELKSFIDNIATNVDLIQTSIKDFEAKAKKDRTIDDYIAIFNSSTRLIESFKNDKILDKLYTIIPAEQSKIETFWTYFQTTKEVTESSLSLYSNVKQKQYCLALNDAKNLYNIRYNPDKLADGENKKDVKFVLSFLLNKGAMICGVAQAKTSQEVYEAIEKVAMPVGSSRVKRMAKYNIAVNAYSGLFLGNEYTTLDFNNNKPRINSYGVTAPIGLSFSRGNIGCRDNHKNKSVSLFISIVDLGAITTFRFQNDTAQTLKKIELKDIISPGIFFSYGLGKCPISLNFGYQVTPLLKEVSENNNTFKPSYGRLSLSILVDIPLFNLFTKTE